MRGEATRIEEDFELVILEGLPQGYVSTYGLLKRSAGKESWERIYENHLSCCSGDDDWPIVLAKIHRKIGESMRDRDIDNVRFRRLVPNKSDRILWLISGMKGQARGHR